FQEAVSEAEEEHVIHRALAEVVVDSENRRLVEGSEEHLVELPSRCGVAAERFLDDDPRSLHRAGLAQLLDDHSEEGGWNRQVVRGPAGGSKLSANGLECRGVLVVAVHVAKPRVEPGERLRVESAMALDAVFGAGPQLLEIPAGLRHADDRNVEVTALR